MTLPIVKNMAVCILGRRRVENLRVNVALDAVAVLLENCAVYAHKVGIYRQGKNLKSCSTLVKMDGILRTTLSILCPLLVVGLVVALKILLAFLHFPQAIILMMLKQKRVIMLMKVITQVFGFLMMGAMKLILVLVFCDWSVIKGSNLVTKNTIVFLFAVC